MQKFSGTELGACFDLNVFSLSLGPRFHYIDACFVHQNAAKILLRAKKNGELNFPCSAWLEKLSGLLLFHTKQTVQKEDWIQSRPFEIYHDDLKM